VRREIEVRVLLQELPQVFAVPSVGHAAAAREQCCQTFIQQVRSFSPEFVRGEKMDHLVRVAIHIVSGEDAIAIVCEPACFMDEHERVQLKAARPKKVRRILAGIVGDGEWIHSEET
jgi:hypothetical protein